MRNCLILIAITVILPLLPLAAADSAPVKPSSEVEPGKEAPDWEARFRKEKGKEHAAEKKEQRKELKKEAKKEAKKEQKKDQKEEKREQKKELRRERKHEH